MEKRRISFKIRNDKLLYRKRKLSQLPELSKRKPKNQNNRHIKDKHGICKQNKYYLKTLINENTNFKREKIVCTNKIM